MTRYDRWGDAIDDEPGVQPDVEPDVHHCEAGWLGEDDQDRPIPCLVCRPHLRERHS